MKRFDLMSCCATPVTDSNDAATLADVTRLTNCIHLNAEDDVQKLKPFLTQLSCVILNFPSFRDGRAFTQARALREKLCFSGEILAGGHPLPDQADFLRRCGFNAVLLQDDAACAAWASHKTHFPQNYQNRFFPS